MFNYLARHHDRKHIERSLQSQHRAAHNAIDFCYDTSLAFGRRNARDSYNDFLDLTLRELSGGTFFEPILPPKPLSIGGTYVEFRSDIETREHNANSTFKCMVTDSGSTDHAIVVFHHLFAQHRYPAFAKFFASKGITVVEATLPYHFERGASGRSSEEMAFSANIGLTVHSIRQAVLDGRKIVQWLKEQGYEKVSVVGMCLGGLVAGLIAAKEENVDKAVLMVTAGSPADVVWSGETMSLLRGRIEPKMSLEEFRRAWGLINLENYVDDFARAGLDTMFLLGQNDTIVREYVSDSFIERLQGADVDPHVHRLNCGHSSISCFPYNVIAAKKVLHFLNEQPKSRGIFSRTLDRFYGEELAVIGI